MATQGSGLEGVVVADTELSDVDGEAGRLVLRGHSVESLAGRVTFEDVLALLHTGALPSASEREQWRAALGRARVAAFERLPALGDALDLPDGMDALRAATAHLRETDAVGIAGALAVFAAAWARRRLATEPGSVASVPPDGALSHAADYVRMVRGEAASAAQVAAVDAYLVTVADHGMNASTFAARVVASTQSDLVSSVVAAIGALKGPLHGGAPGPVLDMLDAIGSADRARAWLEGEIAAGRRIMGMGHRIYRVRDPRAAVLERAATALERSSSSDARLALARRVEREAEALLAERHPDRPLRANVEFYTAVLLEAAGIPRTLFSPTFAVSRVAGWTAHVAEQRRAGRLIRPASRYVGPAPVE